MGLSFSFQLMLEQISYYPCNLSEIVFFILPMTSAGSSSPPQSMRDWISYSPHDLSRIEFLSLVDMGLDFLFSPQP